jgi:hypothetical protein
MVETIEKKLDPRKAKRYRILFLLGGIGMFGICGALVWIFTDRRELPALLLGVVALFWAVVLIYQSLKMREFEDGGDDASGPDGGETGEP